MTSVKKHLQRVGNSTGVVLTAALLAAAGMDRDDGVVIHAESGRITITKLDPEFDQMVAAADRFVSRYPNALRTLGE